MSLEHLQAIFRTLTANEARPVCIDTFVSPVLFFTVTCIFNIGSMRKFAFILMLFMHVLSFLWVFISLSNVIFIHGKINFLLFVTYYYNMINCT